MEDEQLKPVKQRKVLQVDIKPEMLEKFEAKAKTEGYKSLAEKVRSWLVRDYAPYFEENDNPFLGLRELIDNGTAPMQVPDDFYLEDGTLNPKYRSNYSTLNPSQPFPSH